MLFDNVYLDGYPRLVGNLKFKVAESQIVRRYPPLGGDLARLLFPVVVADESKTNPKIREKADASWGWLPPPLVGEGRKFRPTGCTTSC